MSPSYSIRRILLDMAIFAPKLIKNVSIVNSLGTKSAGEIWYWNLIKLKASFGVLGDVFSGLVGGLGSFWVVSARSNYHACI